MGERQRPWTHLAEGTYPAPPHPGTPRLQHHLWEEPKSGDTGVQWPNIGTGREPDS